MKRFRSAPRPWQKRRDGIPACRGGSPSRIRAGEHANFCSILLATVALCLTSNHGFGQTTRTNPSSASTVKSIPSSSSTGPNSPCSNTNPTSPCYSANAPRNPCFSAAAPDEPCSTTVTPNFQTAPPSKKPAASVQKSAERTFTADQAKSQIEAEGYTNVSELRKDTAGRWRGKAVKEGLTLDITLDPGGKVTSN